MSGRKPNILLLTHRVPFPPDRGDRIRSYHLLRYLAERYQVYLGALADERVDERTFGALRRLTVEHTIARLGRRMRWVRAARSLACGRSATEGLFTSMALRKKVSSWARRVKFDAVIAFCSSMVQFADVPELADSPLIVDLVDVDSQKWVDYAVMSRGWKKRLFELEARRVRRLECTLAERADAITLVSEAEANVFRSFCPNDKTFAVANGVDLEYFDRDYPIADHRPNQCIFVGVLDYRPNIDGLIWFCDQVWPSVIARRPDAVFAIVGKNPGQVVEKLSRRPGIRLIGEVTDVRPYIAESRLSVVPLRIARGIQNKVLEAMAMGKPVIATPVALEGLSTTTEVNAISASRSGDWVEEVCRLLADPASCQRLSFAGHNYVHQNHSWTACLRPLGTILERFCLGKHNSSSSLVGKAAHSAPRWYTRHRSSRPLEA